MWDRSWDPLLRLNEDTTENVQPLLLPNVIHFLFMILTIRSLPPPLRSKSLTRTISRI